MPPVTPAYSTDDCIHSVAFKLSFGALMLMLTLSSGAAQDIRATLPAIKLIPCNNVVRFVPFSSCVVIFTLR